MDVGEKSPGRDEPLDLDDEDDSVGRNTKSSSHDSEITASARAVR